MMEAYSVGVRISLINGVSSGLLALSRDFGKANIAAKELQASIRSIKTGLLIGTGLTLAGLGILAMFKPALDEAKKFQNEVAKFSLYGMGDQANREAANFAKSMNVMGSSYVDNMRLMTEAQGIFRESGKNTLSEQLEGAKIASPILAKLAFIEAGLSDDDRSNRHAQDLAMLRFIEARGGANNPQSFGRIADWGFKLMQSSGGVVDWSQLQQLTATSGVAGFNLSEDAISKLEPVIADLKGGRLGSGLRVSFQRLLGTQRGLPRQAVSELLGLGLWDPSKVELSSGGGIKRFTGQPGDVLRDRAKFATDPVGYYTQDFLPAIAKKYGDGILGDSVDARIKRAVEISMVFGPGNASAVFSQIDKLLPAINRSLGAQGRQLGIDASYNAVGNTLSGKQLQLRKEFSNLLESTGEAVLPIAIQGMKTLIPMLRAVDDFATKHPRAFADIAQGLLALGAALTVGGVVTILINLGRAVGLLGTALRVGSWIPRLAGVATTFGKFATMGLEGIGTGLLKVETSLGALGALDLIAIAGGILALVGAAKMAGDYVDQNTNSGSMGDQIIRNISHQGGFMPFGMAGWVFGQKLVHDHFGPHASGGSPHVHPANYSGGAKMQGAVYIDGQKAGRIILGGAVKRASGPAVSGAGFDGSADYTPVGTGLIGT